MRTKEPQNEPLQWISVLKELVKPASSTDELRKTLMSKIIVQAFGKQEKSELSETLKEVKELNDFFGGGQHGANESDIKIAALNADTSLRHAQLNLDARRMVLEMEQAAARDDNITHLIGAAATIGLPALGKVAEKLMSQTQNAPVETHQSQPTPSRAHGAER